jgi:pimeloyl-ACP methyl ester carboxylesterase
VPVTALGAAPAVAGGIDLDLPGREVRLAGTRWPGRGNPVVLLHGLASQRRFWNLVVPHLVGRPILALDQRGHGDSDRPDADYDAQIVAGDLASAMDALGWSRAVVVGHSWGGMVAATFAARHPHRTLALVALDGGFSSPRASGADRAAIRKRLEPPQWALPPDELVAMMRRYSPGAWTPELEAAVLPIFGVGEDGLARARLPFELHMRIVDTLLDYDPEAVLTQVACPTWLVSCESAEPDDEWGRLKAQSLEALRPLLTRPRLLRWIGAVHDVPLQWPALVAGLIRAAADDVTVDTPAGEGPGDGGTPA